MNKTEKMMLVLVALFLAALVGNMGYTHFATQGYSVTTETIGVISLVIPESESETTLQININTATAAELQQLPGIGETRANAIVAYREENGPFQIPEDITKVSGIGQGILENIIDYICVS